MKVLNETEQRKITSSNLKRLLEEKGVSAAEVGRQIGVSESTARSWFNGNRYPRLKQLQALANYFNVSRSDIEGTGTRVLEEESDFSEITSIYSELNQTNRRDVVDYAQTKLDSQNEVKEVPMLGYSAAGVAVEPYGADTTGEVAKTNKTQVDACVVLTGDSMEPRFHQGEAVFYRLQANIENGEFAIVEIDGEGAICKQVKFDYENRKIILHSLNPKYDDIIIDPTRIRILGKVID